jgi:gamma-glutamyl phosphate reductase
VSGPAAVRAVLNAAHTALYVSAESEADHALADRLLAASSAVAGLIEAVHRALAHADPVRDERHAGLRTKDAQAVYDDLMAALANAGSAP